MANTNKTQNNMRKAMLIPAVVFVTAIIATAAVITYNKDQSNPNIIPTVAEDTENVTPTFEAYIDPQSESPTADRLITYEGKQYRYRDDIDTLLIIGTDDYEMQIDEDAHRNNSQSDLLLLVVFDNTNMSYKIIQINRDTMTGIRKYDTFGQYEGIVTLQIALSHTFGSGGNDSCEDTKYAVSRLLYDSDIDNYIEFTMNAVPIINDLVGGVDVVIEDNFEGVDDTFVEGECVHLEGEHALTYVRSRMLMPDDDTNEARMMRQRTYMTALMELLGNRLSEDPDFATTVFQAVGDYMLSDMTTTRLEELTNRFNEYELEEIIVPDGESVMGERYREFYVDEDALQRLVVNTFYEEV